MFFSFFAQPWRCDDLSQAIATVTLPPHPTSPYFPPVRRQQDPSQSVHWSPWHPRHSWSSWQPWSARERWEGWEGCCPGGEGTEGGQGRHRYSILVYYFCAECQRWMFMSVLLFLSRWDRSARPDWRQRWPRRKRGEGAAGRVCCGPQISLQC